MKFTVVRYSIKHFNLIYPETWYKYLTDRHLSKVFFKMFYFGSALLVKLMLKDLNRS